MAFGGTTSGYTFWAKRSADEVRDEIKAKTAKYFMAANRCGLQQMWGIAWAQYYGTDPANPGDMATQTTSRTGPNAEFTRFRINEVRSFIKQGNVIALGERPAFQCLVLNSDHEALASVGIADNVINYVYREALGEEKERLLLETDGVFGAAYQHIRWDFEGGAEIEVMEPVTDEAGRPQMMLGPEGDYIPAERPVKERSGAPYVDIAAPWEVVLDPNARDIRWAIVRERVSKWEVAATYPEAEEEILQAAGMDEWIVERLFGYGYNSDDNTDDCIVEHFYYPPDRIMPDGRYMGVCGGVVLWDGPCPVSEGIPVVEMCGGKFFGKAFGYADSWDLISIQEMIDQLCSDTASNLSTFGRQILVYDKGAEMDFTKIALGLQALAKTPGSEAPQAINYAAMPDSVQWFLEYLHSRHQSISGINSTARGQSDKNVTSGQMAALYHSIAIEYQSARQAALDGSRKRTANVMLDMVRNFAHTKFVVEVAGVSQRPYLAEFAKDTLRGVKKVVVETTNPLARSQAGRFEMYNALRAVPPEDRGAVMRGLTTGDWSGYIEASKSCDLRIVYENEQLMNGVQCSVAVGDHPFKHVKEHYALFEKISSTPNPNPELIQLVLTHIIEHLMQWQWIDPRLATVLSIPLPPPLPGSPTAELAMLTSAPPPPAGVPGSPGGPEGAPVPPPPALSGGGQAPPKPQRRDPSGVNLPNPSVPPPGAQMQSQAQA